MELKDIKLEELEKRYKSERDGKIKELDSSIDKPYTMKNGYTRGWQTKDVQVLIKSKFGVSYGSKHVRRIISNLGFVRLVPRPRHKRRNQKDVDEFKEQFKKNAKVLVKT